MKRQLYNPKKMKSVNNSGQGGLEAVPSAVEPPDYSTGATHTLIAALQRTQLSHVQTPNPENCQIIICVALSCNGCSKMEQ